MTLAPGMPTVAAWHSPAGLFEKYRYEPGPAGRDQTHVHPDVQVCLSVNAPGRYRSGRYAVDVPAGAVSVVDAWEPHAAEDPHAREISALYHVLYVPTHHWDRVAADQGQPTRLGITVNQNTEASAALAALSASVERQASALEQHERFTGLMAALAGHQHFRRSWDATPDARRVNRAREYIRAHALRGVTLAEAAREADLSPQHFAASFRARYGMPPYRFQTLLRLDHARHLLAFGVAAADVATQCGFTDQSHLNRHFKRYLGFTPGRYRALPQKTG